MKYSIKIPAIDIALGRMQELFKIILESMQIGILRKAPVYSTGLSMDI